MGIFRVGVRPGWCGNPPLLLPRKAVDRGKLPHVSRGGGEITKGWFINQSTFILRLFNISALRRSRPRPGRNSSLKEVLMEW